MSVGGGPSERGRAPLCPGLAGKAVLVTGGAGGIGAALLRLFAAQGAAVGIHYHRSRGPALALQEELRRSQAAAECFRGDLTKPADCGRVMREFLRRFGRVDVLVNNAGAAVARRHFLELAPEVWDEAFALNARAPFLLAREAFRRMRKQGGGRIVNISSIAARYGGATHSVHYGAAKAALEAMTRGLARAGAGHGILVNCIQAGAIDTPFHRKIGRGRAALAKRGALIPVGRTGEPLDVARLAVFLASEAGGYITGDVIAVSGGD